MAENNNILQHANASLLSGNWKSRVNDFNKAYQAGRAAGAKVAPGVLFLGGYGYADWYAGSNTANRLLPEWKGALTGYMDGLPPHRSITVDSNGMVISINE